MHARILCDEHQLLSHKEPSVHIWAAAAAGVQLLTNVLLLVLRCVSAAARNMLQAERYQHIVHACLKLWPSLWVASDSRHVFDALNLVWVIPCLTAQLSAGRSG